MLKILSNQRAAATKVRPIKFENPLALKSRVAQQVFQKTDFTYLPFRDVLRFECWNHLGALLSCISLFFISKNMLLYLNNILYGQRVERERSIYPSTSTAP